ncbi:hypothetical protein AAC387_Pa11g1703 [Persea americana]
MHTLALSTTPSSPFLNPPNRTVQNPSLPLSLNPVRPIPTRRTNSPPSIACNVALKTDPPATVSSPSEESDPARIGARVRVKVPLKVYHVQKIGEIDLYNKEGTMKQYVGLWKGKTISANLPFKVEFVEEVESRGPVKFFAHLKEDEFDYVE